VSVLLITNTDRRTTERSTSDSLGDVLWVHKLYRRNVPLLHTSLHVISFTRHFPALVLKVTNARVRRPGYEAMFKLHTYMYIDSTNHTPNLELKQLIFLQPKNCMQKLKHLQILITFQCVNYRYVRTQQVLNGTDVPELDSSHSLYEQ